jgi:hypothetical protein
MVSSNFFIVVSPFASVDGRRRLFPSYRENVVARETCRKFLTTEDSGDTEVTSGNHAERAFIVCE